MAREILKDPADVFDVQASHARQMAHDDDTITASEWRVDDDAEDALVIGASPAPSFTDTTATCWVSGGVEGGNYRLVNTVETAGGRTWERTATIKVTNR